MNLPQAFLMTGLALLSGIPVTGDGPLPPRTVPSGSVIALDDANRGLKRDLDERYIALSERLQAWKNRTPRLQRNT